MSVYVFVGPTLPVSEARKILDATYLPPVASGDVQHLMSSKPRAIGIIDGLFEGKPAVFHKEILHALASGVRVFGASSMGALRAAELHAFGMVGIGEIFEAFRSGELEDDDEVALIHGPAESGYASYSLAMVNMREGLRRAHLAGVIPEEVRDALTAMAKATFYAERSWARLFHEAKASGVAIDDLKAFLERAQPDLKREDAARLLRTMAEKLSAGPGTSASFTFSPTAWWKRLVREVEHADGYGQRPSSSVPAKRFTLHARLFADPERALAREALFLSLIDEAAELRGIEARTEEIAQELATRHLRADDPAARAHARSEVLIRKLIARAPEDRLGRHVPGILSAEGRLRKIVDKVRRKWEWLLARGLSETSAAEANVDPDELLAWYRKRFGAREPTLEALADSLGLRSEDVRDELLSEYLFEVGRRARRTPGRGPRARAT